VRRRLSAGARGRLDPRPRRVGAALGVLALLGSASPAPAEPSPEDKSRYHLLDPTPRALRRPLSADRPDVTESPYTVDAGAVQLEMSVVDYAKNGDAVAWSAAPFNLKLGLLNDVDLQLVFDPYLHEDDGARARDGPGDVQVRVKVNLWGNDGGASALAVMPFVKAPTAADGLGNGHVEGGVILPFATDAAGIVGVGLMLEGDVVFDQADDGYDAEVVASGVLGRNLTETVGVYVEAVGIASTDAGVDPRALLGFGATYALGDDVVLDAGTNLGLTGDADDVNLFAGLTVRF